MTGARVVLMPGLDGTGRLFDWVLPHLPVHPEPLIVRYPPHEPLGYDALEEFVFEQLRGVGDVVLVAESFSGPLAVKVADARRDRVRGLVFVAAFVANPLRLLRPWTAPLVPSWPFAFSNAALVRRLLAGPDAPDEVVQAVLAANRLVDREVIAHRVRQLLAADEWSRYEQLELPMLYLRGRADRLIPPAHADDMRRRHRRLVLADLDAPHLVLQCAATAAGARVQAFVRAL